MQIDPIGGAVPVSPGTRTRRRQADFAVPDAAETPPAAVPAEAPAAAAVPLLALQGEAAGRATDAAADQQAAARASTLLGAMRGLQLAMLDGRAAPAELAKLGENLPAATDPALDAVLRAIAQRAAVERARRG